jgi:hypothetical protein
MAMQRLYESDRNRWWTSSEIAARKELSGVARDSILYVLRHHSRQGVVLRRNHYAGVTSISSINLLRSRRAGDTDSAGLGERSEALLRKDETKYSSHVSVFLQLAGRDALFKTKDPLYALEELFLAYDILRQSHSFYKKARAVLNNGNHGKLGVMSFIERICSQDSANYPSSFAFIRQAARVRSIGALMTMWRSYSAQELLEAFSDHQRPIFFDDQDLLISGLKL